MTLGSRSTYYTESRSKATENGQLVRSTRLPSAKRKQLSSAREREEEKTHVERPRDVLSRSGLGEEGREPIVVGGGRSFLDSTVGLEERKEGR